MIKLSNSKLLSIFTKVLILALIAKSISLSLMWMMPSDGVSLNIKTSYQPKFQRVDFKNMLNAEVKQEQTKQITTDSGANGISITNMLLKGLYGTKEKGFVIVSLKSSPKKTTILSVGEIFSGYKLKYIGANSATFVKNSTDFILRMSEVKSKASSLRVKSVSRSNKNNYDEPISQQVVSRSDIAYYAKNPKQIWREISIREVKDGKKIKGFKVTRIDPKSKFATMGLKKGDLITKANNVELKSYRDALDIYTKIDKIDVVQLIVIRNGQEKEIVYEIN